MRNGCAPIMRRRRKSCLAFCKIFAKAHHVPQIPTTPRSFPRAPETSPASLFCIQILFRYKENDCKICRGISSSSPLLKFILLSFFHPFFLSFFLSFLLSLFLSFFLFFFLASFGAVKMSKVRGALCKI